MRATAASESTNEIVDSIAWQAHFEGWIERFLIAPEVTAAQASLPGANPEATYRVVTELTEQRLRALERPSALPPDVEPRITASGLQGRAMSAARLHAQGDSEAALSELASPELERDAGALHLRAQLLDELGSSAAPRDRLDVIAAYRLALSFDASSPRAARARVRIAQLYLELDFAREAAAALANHLASLPSPYQISATLTFVEAAIRARQPELALRSLDAISRDELNAQQRAWVLRTSADLRFATRDDVGAIEAYRAYTNLLAQSGTTEPDALSALRAAFATLESGRIDDARAQLAALHARPDTGTTESERASQTAAATDDAAVAEDASPAGDAEGFEDTGETADPIEGGASALMPLVALLRVQTEAAANRPTEMETLATQGLARHLGTPEAPLLAIAVLEAQRRGNPDRSTPPGVASMTDPETSDPATALLTHRLAVAHAHPFDDDLLLSSMARLARRLPQGPVKALIHDEMAHRLLENLRRDRDAARLPTATLLDLMENELSPRQMEENGLLLGLEAFRASGRIDVCARWARALRDREVRPLRRGLGAWREAQCRLQSDQPFTQEELAEIVDSGVAGPFSLAFAAVMSETAIRRSEIEPAIRIYERALEAFAEPMIVGPVLLRLGELHAAAGRDGLAQRRLLRGLGVTASQVSASDPFRKIGLVTLAKLVRRGGDRARLRQALAPDLAAAEPWWQGAYTFLGQRAGLPLAALAADDPFSSIARRLSEASSIDAQLRKVASRAPSAAAAKAAP